MSLKTKKFNDSVVMKSFKHLALEKGMIKPEEIKKEAKAALDLNPVEDFTSNVMKLIAGLRKDGLEKFANDLEDHFVNYKMAESSYGVHKETGDDLVDMAHPKGSHKLEGVLGDATIETILDNHLKMMQIVNKKPSGKLSSAKEIINAVKVSVAQENQVSDDELDKETSKLSLSKLKQIPKKLNLIYKLRFSSSGAQVKASFNVGKIEEYINSAIGVSPELFDEIEDCLDNIEQVFNSINLEDVSAIAGSTLPIGTFYSLYQNINKWGFGIKSLTSSTPIGSIYNYFSNRQDIKNDIFYGIKSSLKNIVGESRNILKDAKATLKGVYEDEIKQSIIDKKNKEALEKSKKDKEKNTNSFNDDINTAIGRLYGIISLIQSQTRLSPSVKGEHLAWANKQINIGKNLLNNPEVNKQNVEEFKNEVNEFATTWGI